MCNDVVKSPLTTLYTYLFRILLRTDNAFTIDPTGRKYTVSVDRRKKGLLKETFFFPIADDTYTIFQTQPAQPPPDFMTIIGMDRVSHKDLNYFSAF